MSFWKRTMDYLGLGPDDAYDDYDIEDDYEPAPSRRRAPEPEPRQRPPREDTGSEGVVRTLPSRPTFPSRDFDPSQARRAPERVDDSGVQPRPQRATTGGNVEPTTVRPRRFDQAQEVADKFKDGQPVIRNLEGSDREVARRLIDFASGLCYGLDGSMEKVANGVYLLKPAAARSARYDEYDD
jgi:cell division inhibitor SepF